MSELHPFKIERVWMILAWSKDPDGRMSEGMPAMAGPGGVWIPLLATDEARLVDVTEMAKEIQGVTGMPMKLVEFTERRDVRDI